MAETRDYNRKDDTPEVIRVSPPDYSYTEIKSGPDNKKKNGGIGNIVDNILDKVKSVLSKLLGREVGTDDVLLLGMIILFFWEKRNKDKNADDDLELLLMVLIYLFVS